MKLPRRKFLHLAAGAAVLPAFPRVASALDYPTRPVQIIVGLPAGSATDIVARLVGQTLSKRFARPFIIENRPGAATNIGTELAVRAPADGHTLLLITSINAINASLYHRLSFNFIHDIAPIARIGKTLFVMAVNPSVPAKTVPEFIAYAKANPGKIAMASPGIGSSNHVFGALFEIMADVELLHVPYRSSYMPDLIGGQVQVVFNPIGQSIEYIRSGKIRALAVTTQTRVAILPEIPTVSETVPGYEANGWTGVGAPRSTPIEIIEKLNSQINAVIADPNVKDRLVAIGVEPSPMTPDDFAKLIADETDKWAKVIKFANIKPE